MAEKQVPSGARIQFWVNDEEINPGVQMRVQEDVALSLSSEFTEVFGSKGVSNFEKVASDAIAAASGLRVSSQFKEFGFQTWRKTAPLALTVTITFNFKTDAYTDVVSPTRELISLAIPDDTGVDNNGVGMILPGPNILSIFGLSEGNDSGSAMIKCKIGWMNFSSILVRKAEPVYSKHVDSNGYPIWSTVTLNIESVYTATRQMINLMTPEKFPDGTN